LSVKQSNLLLDSLSPESRDRILSVSKAVALPLRTPLIEAIEPPEYAYFMTSGIASVVIELAEGGTAEVALIGYEGVVGALQLLGPTLASSRCFIQVAGTAYKTPFAELKKIFMDTEEVRSRVLEGIQQQSFTTSQLTACNRLHEAGPRLARWLLMVHDRIKSDTVGITQEFLGQMLGLQRPTVATVAAPLQRSGTISFNYGKVIIHSRKELEKAACECYRPINDFYSGLYQQ
jgi:CRP-like cAMP-binding protein